MSVVLSVFSSVISSVILCVTLHKYSPVYTVILFCRPGGARQCPRSRHFLVKTMAMTEIGNNQKSTFLKLVLTTKFLYLSNGKTGLLWIFGLKMTKLQVLCHFGFWGPSAYEFAKFDENIWLAFMATLRTTYFWRVIWNSPHPELHYPKPGRAPKQP